MNISAFAAPALNQVRTQLITREDGQVDNLVRALLCLLGPEMAWREAVAERHHSVGSPPAKPLLDAVGSRLPHEQVHLVLREDTGHGTVSLMYHAETHRENAATMLGMAVSQISECTTAAWKKDCAEGKQHALPRCKMTPPRGRRGRRGTVNLSDFCPLGLPSNVALREFKRALHK